MTPILVFVALAYGVSWAIWLPLVASSLGWIDGHPSQYLHLLGGIGPLVGAFVVARAYGGRRAARELARRVRLWRLPARWHLVAWLGPVALYGIAALIVGTVWGAWPDVSRFGRTEEFPHIPMLLYWSGCIVFYGWGEETGWRGFLLPLLQDRMTAMNATLLITPIWILWHFPLFFFIDGYVDMGPGDIAGWAMSIFTGSVLLTWMFNSSMGSVFIVAIFHGMLDVVFNSPSSGDLALVLGVLITLWGIWILARYSWRDLANTPRQKWKLDPAAPSAGGF